MDPREAQTMDRPMARYLIQVPRDVLSGERKADIGKSIVLAHHEVTGDAAVHVAITEIDIGRFFAGGPLIKRDHIFVLGYLVGNVTTERKEALSTRLSADVARAADFDLDSTWVTITEL
jgi:phenylpyruvate tautomerase PptA (4-oxalocrotonate tautomerase family)